jgi:flagellar protein FlaJ
MKKSEKTLPLTTISYRLFGKTASRLGFFTQAYRQSGIPRSYDSYMALMLFTSLIAFASTLAVGSLAHYFLFKLAFVQVLAAASILSCVVTLTVPIVFVAYPLYRRSQRRKEIEASLIYTTGYMGVLSAGGISIEKIFERVTEVERHLPIRDLACRLMTNVRILGMDVVSSLSDVMIHSPSESFTRLLASIMNTLKTSADLKTLLTFETQRLLHAKREQLKKTLNALMAFGEIYITGVVIGPVVFIVMITILSVMGNVAMGMSPVTQLNLLVFFGIPMISTVSILMLNSILPEEE